MQILNTSDTINQGRVKVNDAIDHIITGATTSTTPGQIDFKSNSGLYDFSGSINFPNTQDGGIIDGMIVSQDASNPLKWNVSAGTYFVGGTAYSYAGGSVTLNAGPNPGISPGRADLIVATSAGVTVVAGSANSTTPATAFYQESSTLPLAVIIVAASATSSSQPNQVVRANVNFSGRLNPVGDTPEHSLNGFNGSNSKMSINMGNAGFMDSQYSYIFGGTNNKLSGTSYSTSASTYPNNTIVGGKDNLLTGADSLYSGIFGSNLCTLSNAVNSNIVGSRNITATNPSQSTFLNCLNSYFFDQKTSTFINAQFCTGYTNSGTGNLILNSDFSTISQGVQDCGMLLTSYSHLSGTSSNSGIFGGRDANMNGNDYCVIVGGSYNFLTKSTNVFLTGSHNTGSTMSDSFISGTRNRIDGSYFSSILGGSGNTITTTSQGSTIINCLNTKLANVIGQVAIATNGYDDSSITTPTYCLTTDNLKINKDLLYGINSFKSGSTNANSQIVQACDPVGGGSTTQIFLPSSPYDGQVKIIKDATGTASGANTVTVKGNGLFIDGSADYIIDTAYGSVTVVYSAHYDKWLIV